MVGDSVAPDRSSPESEDDRNRLIAPRPGVKGVDGEGNGLIKPGSGPSKHGAQGRMTSGGSRGGVKWVSKGRYAIHCQKRIRIRTTCAMLT